MDNIRTQFPKIGDAVVGNLTTQKVEFITGESFVNNLGANYELIGVVYKREGKKVKIAYKGNAAKTWCDRYEWILRGYTLDSTARSGVISIRNNSSASANTDYTVNYNCADKAALVTTLNTFFANTTAFNTQDWFARVEGENVIVSCAFTFSGQTNYNTGKTGFTMTANTLPDVPASAQILRANGANNGDGAISSYEKALAYFASDISSATYNPDSEVTSIKTRYPVCKPAYLGTSQHQSDHCALLRSTYGAGEEGWKRYMKAQMAVYPCGYGVMIDDEKVGLARTNLMASKTYNSQLKNNEPLCKAAKYCHDIATTCIPSGWYLPTTEDLSELLETIKYPTPNNSRNADPINKTLNAMGGNAISNNYNWWSSCRCYASSAWYSDGGLGFLSYNLLFSGCYSLPVSLYILP